MVMYRCDYKRFAPRHVAYVVHSQWHQRYDVDDVVNFPAVHAGDIDVDVYCRVVARDPVDPSRPRVFRVTCHLAPDVDWMPSIYDTVSW